MWKAFSHLKAGLPEALDEPLKLCRKLGPLENHHLQVRPRQAARNGLGKAAKCRHQQDGVSRMASAGWHQQDGFSRMASAGWKWPRIIVSLVIWVTSVLQVVTGKQCCDCEREAP